MPYTPPTNRSPSCSAPASPDATRRSSFTATGPGSCSPRPTLPRSASYAAKHRRTPSAVSFSLPVNSVTNGSSPEITPPGTSDDLKGMLAAHTGPIRQSPPPVTTSRNMPPGAIISPPDSASEDEGVPEHADRGRQIENLKELKEAISTLPQHRSPSPDRSSAQPGDLLVLPSQLNELSATEPPKPSTTTTLPPITTIAARKSSHHRSATEPRIFVSKSADNSVAVSDDSEEQDDEPLTKPVMVRKKSGELVRPALRAASHRRPSSMPGTPTFSKAVHFDSHLEHVRHFLQVDRPLAVSASSSPNENYESDTEYPFGTASNTSPGLDIVLPNFPADNPIRKALPVRVERVWLSSDQKSLVGMVSVANLAFQKNVLCRFTYDYWKTTSEIAAEYSHTASNPPQESGYDRFQFTLKLSDLANFESRTLFFCVRYTVNGTDYWDNNDGVNFQVDFTKKAPRPAKRAPRDPARSMGALPRSNRRTHTIPRPRSMPVGALDDFGNDAKLADLDQPLHEVLGESRPSSLRLKSSKSSLALPTDNLANKVATPSGQAFANRYDFGASLSAAKEAQRRPEKEALYMKPNKKAAFSLAPAAEVPRTVAAVPETGFSSPRPQAQAKPEPSASPVPGTDSPSAVNIRSSSYEEILNKYCFFNGSKQSSPQLKDGTLTAGRYDGSDDPFTPISNSNDSSVAGSPNMTDRSHRGALHYSIHQSLRQNLNPYFQNGQMSAIGASPVESPLQHPSMSATMSTTSGLSKSSSTSPTPMTGFAPFASKTTHHHLRPVRPSTYTSSNQRMI